ncbi:hypothetical protein [uncultured Nostoc sp.]|uniref:hypothetical protein n=1 Tax=uncultured Nostoc sp. TaxID=340711 RepID=UPI0035CB7A1C
MSRQIDDDARAIAFFQRIIAFTGSDPIAISVMKSYLTMHKLEIFLTSSIQNE